jgi:hypothetical protein
MTGLCPECQKEPFEKINDIFSYDVQTRYSKLDDPETVTLIKIEDQKERQLLQTFLNNLS